jgi:hypothetical protein
MPLHGDVPNDTWLSLTSCKRNQQFNRSQWFRTSWKPPFDWKCKPSRLPTLLFIGEVRLCWVHLVRQPLLDLLYQPLLMVDFESGDVCWIKTGRGKRGTQRKPSSMLLCPQRILHGLSRNRSRAAKAGILRLMVGAITEIDFSYQWVSWEIVSQV